RRTRQGRGGVRNECAEKNGHNLHGEAIGRRYFCKWDWRLPGKDLWYWPCWGLGQSSCVAVGRRLLAEVIERSFSSGCHWSPSWYCDVRLGEQPRAAGPRQEFR